MTEHMQDQYGIRPEAVEFPMMCVLSFVYICNARCPSCPYTNSEIRKSYKDRLFMGENTFKIIADQCGEYGAWIRISGGGEPLMHPQAVDLLEYAKMAGAKIGLITNGSLFNSKNTEELLEANIDMFEFSVDAGDEKTYNRVRPGLDWTTLVENVKRIVYLRNKMKSTSKIIASAVNQIGIDIERVESFWGGLVDTFQKRKYLTWAINDPNNSGDATPYLPPEQRIPCPFLFERLNIDSRGKVMICGFDIAAKTDMGNIHDKNIREIWHSKEFQYYRDKHLMGCGDDIPLCKKCPDWQYRSWKYNYWKIVENAKVNAKEKLGKFDYQDTDGFTVCLEDRKEIK